MQTTMKKPCEIIKIDKYTGKIEPPALLLLNRSFEKIGKIGRYENWNLSLAANSIDEISFDVHKYSDGKLCPVWDDLVDLKIVDAGGFGRFEISVDYTDNTETVKFVHGYSLETELAQIGLYEFHVNDEEAADREITEYSKNNYDSKGNFIPTTFYREILDKDSPEEAKFKRSHSLLHRVLADKAPHWSIGYVTPYIAMDEKSQPEASSKFQRTYTVDGDSIYDFLTGTVAEESNVVFLFDTVSRTINCYSLCDCIDQKTGRIMTDGDDRPANGIGEDTLVFVSKNKLANEITISSNKDRIKNCFRVEGGDDVITDMARAASMNGSNYIYRFAPFQSEDMSQGLRDKLKAYQQMMSDPDTMAAYYGYGDMEHFFDGNLTLEISSDLEANSVLSLCKGKKIETDKTTAHSFSKYQYWRVETSNGSKKLRTSSTKTPARNAQSALDSMGIYPRLCDAYDRLAYYESAMMPDTEMATEPGSAKAQYDRVAEQLTASPVAVSDMGIYDENSFSGVTKNVKAYAQIFLDPRFDLEIIEGENPYTCTTQTDETGKETATGTWSGKIKITQRTDKTNVWPADSSAAPLSVTINDEKKAFARQKLEKKLSEGSMLDVDFKVAEMKEESDIRGYFNLYSLNRLQSFSDGYNSCLSVLDALGQTTKSSTTTSFERNNLYDKYVRLSKIVSNPNPNENFPNAGVLEFRQEQIKAVKDAIKGIETEQDVFRDGDAAHDPHDFQKYMGGHYLEFCKYRREDTYKNDNYISDGLSSSECLAKAKELLEVAGKEADKACMPQRTVSTSLNNLFALPEFDGLYEKFALFNYIRVRTEDEILKLRLTGIEFSGESASEIQVTFSEQIESVDGTADDLQSLLKQAGGMATSYPSTARQSRLGSEADAEIKSMYRDGLNAAKMALSNNADSEVTITEHSGILCRQKSDEDSYSGKQLKITGNIMAFTDDDWKSVRMGIGETEFKDPLTGKTRDAYGIVAENIVGKLIAGERAYIGNSDNNVLITGNGIDILNGSILLENDEYSIEIDPTNRLQSNPDEKYLFCIRHKTDASPDENTDDTARNNVIMGVDTSGNGYFKGKIEAKEGKIANFNIQENYLCTDETKFGEQTGIHFGQDGLSIRGNFKVDSNGNLTTSSGKIGGWNMNSHKLSCTTISGGTLDLDAKNGCIYSISENNKAILTSGYLALYKNNSVMCMMHGANWAHDNLLCGAGIYCQKNSKFLVLGHDDNKNDSEYIADIVINNGLNLNEHKEPVQILSNTFLGASLSLTGCLYFNKAYLTGSGNNDIYSNGNLDIGGNLYVQGAIDEDSMFSGAPNLHIGSLRGKIAKTTGSSKRFKNEIRQVDSDILNPERLYDIDIVQYKFKKGYLSEADPRHNKDVIGFIAEDIYEKYPIAADFSIDKDGNTIVEDWNFRYMVPAMLKLIQDQKKAIDSLEKRIVKA